MLEMKDGRKPAWVSSCHETTSATDTDGRLRSKGADESEIKAG